MKRSLVLSFVIVIVASNIFAQKVKTARKQTATRTSGNPAIVIDDRLSVLRREPRLYAEPVKRFEAGTKLNVFEEKKGDGVLFYKVSDNTAVSGWIQAEAIAGNFRKNDDHRVAQLIFGSTGFNRVQRSVVFLDLFEDSPMRPTILLLLGDTVEEIAAEISKNAAEKLVRREMAAAGAPLHSFYLNFSELDRYQEIGIRFLFNGNTQLLHYSGDSWFEITRRFPEIPLTIQARERIKSLTEKMKAEQ